MSKKVYVLLAEGFELIEAMTPVDVLRRGGAEVITGLIGSVISSNIVTPIARNKYAAIKQKQAISNMNKPTDDKNNSNNPVKIENRISMEAYQKLASVKYSSGSLKI